jgi:flagellin
MAFSINTNIASLQSQYYLNQTQAFQTKTINRVTSGLRIVNSGDDAAGLAVANGLRSDQAVVTQGIRNINDAQAQLQTVDSGMSNIGNLLDRLRTLAGQASSTTFTGDPKTLQDEFSSTVAEITRQATAIKMNSGGALAAAGTVFIGGGTSTGNGSVSLDLAGAAVDAASLGLTSNTASGLVVDLGKSTDVTQAAKDAKVAAAVATAGASAAFTFDDATSFGGSGTVTVTVGLTGITTQAGLLKAINDGIQQAASSNPNFAAANYAASIDNTSGALTFSTSEAKFATSGAKVTGDADATGAGALGFTTTDVNVAQGAFNILTPGAATTATDTIAAAVGLLGQAQAAVGKSENILTYSLNLASTQLTNFASSQSQIRDADLAAEAANLSKAQILSQAGVAALAQANSAPQAVLSLLKG